METTMLPLPSLYLLRSPAPFQNSDSDRSIVHGFGLFKLTQWLKTPEEQLFLQSVRHSIGLSPSTGTRARIHLCRTADLDVISHYTVPVVTLSVLPGEEQPDVGADEEALGAEMQN